MSELKTATIAARVIAGVLTASVLGIAAYIPGVVLWLSDFASSLKTHLLSTSSIQTSNLYLLVLMSAQTLIYWIIRAIKPKGPSVTEYNQDTFFDLSWHWSYINKIPCNPQPFCPHCDTRLVYCNSGGYSRFDEPITVIIYCETCNKALLNHKDDISYLEQKIVRQIDRKIRTGEWLHVISPRGKQKT